MKFYKPKFWDKRGQIGLFSILLMPLTLITLIKNYYENSKIKKNFYDLKTICVGNIYIGGTGKTPLVNNLADHFKKKFKTFIIKKNYTSHLDEKKLLELKHKVIFEKARELSITKAENEKAEMLIFDDGLQEKKINYDLKFVCFDSKNWIGNGLLIPSGPLREEINSLRKYDGVFLKVTNANIDLNKIKLVIKDINPKIEVFDTYVEIKNIKRLSVSNKYLIFSGIGNSRSFKEILENNNFNIIDEKIFADHYDYQNQDIQKILEIAKHKDLKILTTEKDYTKIPDDLKSEINFVEIDLRIPKEDKLIKFIKSKIDERN